MILPLALLLAPADDLPGDIERCGVARTAIVADEAPFPHVIVQGDASDAQLDCIAAIPMLVRRVSFSDAAVDARYLPRFTGASHRRAVADSRDWLAHRGLLDRLPRFDPAHQSLAAFAISLERFCGARSRSLLHAHDNALDIRVPRPLRIPIPVVQCVMMAALASDLPSHGYVLMSDGDPIVWTQING